MTPIYLHAVHGLVVTNIPHAEKLLDALNPRGALRVLDVNIDRPRAAVLCAELSLTGLDQIAAESWAVDHSDQALLRVHAPLRRGHTGRLWFGRVRFESAPDAYLQLDMPFAVVTNPNPRESFLTLTTSEDAAALDAWAQEQRATLAQRAVERILQPILQQLDHFKVEAVALGLATAMRGLEPAKSASLLGCLAPVIVTSWLRAWARTLALHAPLLTRIEAEVVAEAAPDDALQWQPMVQRLRLIRRFAEPSSVSPRESETYWEEEDHARELAQLRSVTGASLDDSAAVVSFLEDAAALMLLQYRTTGATTIELSTPPATPETAARG